jgi:hypothetical protein
MSGSEKHAMFKIVPFSALPSQVRRTAAPTESPWRWAVFLGDDGFPMKLFWGARVPSSSPAARGSFARNLGENVLFDFHQTSDGWLVFMTDDVEI